MSKRRGPLKLFSGTANVPLAESICRHLKLSLGNSKMERFDDGEIKLQLVENVRGADVFIIQSTCPPVNERLMELLLMIDAARRASADRITAVIPYYGYARQDRKDRPRVPISAKLVANLIKVAGADRVLTIDLHAGQIQGFFDIPVDNLYAARTLVKQFKSLRRKNLVVAAPDFGSVKRANAVARILGKDSEHPLPIVIVDKYRPAPGQAMVGHVIGSVQDKDVIIVDDMIGSGSTIKASAPALKKYGARRIWMCATHAVLSGDAVKVIAEAPVEKVILCNTIPFDETAVSKLQTCDIAPLLAEAIHRIHRESSISSLFQEMYGCQ